MVQNHNSHKERPTSQNHHSSEEQPSCQNHADSQQPHESPRQFCSHHHYQLDAQQQLFLCPEHLQQMNLQCQVQQPSYCMDHHIYNLQSASGQGQKTDQQNPSCTKSPPKEPPKTEESKTPKPEPSKTAPSKCQKKEPSPPAKCPSQPKPQTPKASDSSPKSNGKPVCFCTSEKYDYTHGKGPALDDALIVQACQDYRYNENHKKSSSHQQMHHHHDHPKRNRRLHQCPNETSNSTIEGSKGVCNVS